MRSVEFPVVPFEQYADGAVRLQAEIEDEGLRCVLPASDTSDHGPWTGEAIIDIDHVRLTIVRADGQVLASMRADRVPDEPDDEPDEEA